MRKILHFARHTWFSFSRGCKFIFQHSEKWYHLTVIVATITAGGWAFFTFVIERNLQAHLGLDIKVDISTNSPALGEKRLVFLDVILTNEGRRKLEAKRVSTDNIAYQDPGETIKYPCGIQVRKIETNLIKTNKSLDWFSDTNLLCCPSGIPDEIDMLGEYELIDPSKASQPGTPHFWIEPSEQYHLGTALILPKGDYLVKLHFLGNHTDEDFWSRIVYIQIN